MIGDSKDELGDWDVTHSYDSSAELPSEVVVRAVAGTTNQTVCSIDPLYDAVDPDALDSFVDDRESATWLSFSYAGCRVYVDDDTVSVSQISD